MNNTEIEEIYKQTFSGLALFYRDTTLSEGLISKYKIGQILTERGFTDMTYKDGGLATNCRYLIASANAKDLSAFNPDSKEFGHVLLTSNAFFKVLDIYKIGNKTQIFLLEIPATAVDFFANVTINIENDITKKAREGFDTKINSEPIPELQTQDWKDRTEFPIGMNEKGEFFYTAGDKKPNKGKSSHGKNSILIFGLILFGFYFWGQHTKETVKADSTPIIIKWVENLPGDFSFTNNWSYPEGVYKNEYGQLSCDGLCPPEIDAMIDSTGRIYADSLHAFYAIIDTTHQSYSIQCEARIYEYNGTNFIEVNRLSNDSFHCFTLTTISTHCSLNIDILRDSCYAIIDLNSIDTSGSEIFYCKNGNITIDKNLWKAGIMKAVFSFNFENKENLKEPIYWKGKIYSRIK